MISTGVQVPLVTPVDSAGAVCREDVRSMIDFLRPHVDGLVPALSTGEGGALDDRQWRDMVSATVEFAKGLPVYAGALSPTTGGVIEKAVQAAGLGADAVIATTPYGMGVTQQQMFQHYAEIYAASPLPVIVYDEVDQSGNVLELSTLLGICKLPGVVAVKDSQGELAALGVPGGGQPRRGAVARPGGARRQRPPLPTGCCWRWPTWCRNSANAGGVAGNRNWPTQIIEACQQNSLFDPSWYVKVKMALKRSRPDQP